MYDWPNVDRLAVRAFREARLAELMASNDLDHLLLQYFDNIRYASDYRVMTTAENQDWWTALVNEEIETRLFVPFCDEVINQPNATLPKLLSWIPAPSWSPGTMHWEIYARQITEWVTRAGAERVGYDTMPPQLLAALVTSLPDVTFVSIAADLFERRVEKHPGELSLLRAASQANAIAAEAALAALAPGMRDFDVLAVAMESLQRQGCEYLTHSVCNVRQPSLEWFANGAELRAGDAFFFDIGCLGQGGYASDICRTAFVGEPDPTVSRAYDVLLEAYQAGRDRARPGVKVSTIHDTTNEVLERNGLPRTPYAVGHGIGLRACEWPTIYRSDMMRADATLTCDAAIALEPETFVEVGGDVIVLKVEDNFIVHENGLELLSGIEAANPAT